MKHYYESPETELIKFIAADIVTTSIIDDNDKVSTPDPNDGDWD